MKSRPKHPALSRFKFPVVLADKTKIELEKYSTDKDRARDSVRGFIAREEADALALRFDDLLLAGDFAGARRALSDLDPSALRVASISVVLMVTKAAKDELGAARIAFADRARAALSGKFAPDVVDSIFRRHG